MQYESTRLSEEFKRDLATNPRYRKFKMEQGSIQPTPRVRYLLRHLNDNYGRGEISSLFYDGQSRTGFVIRRVPVGNGGYFTEQRRFTIKDNKLRYLGRTRVVNVMTKRRPI